MSGGPLAWAGGPEPLGAETRVRSFRRFLLLYAAARSWLWVAFSLHDRELLVLAAALASAGFALCWRRDLEAWAAPLGLLGVGLQTVWRFPHGANHLYLELLALALVALAGRGARPDAALVLSGLRWLAALVLFHTGLQKLLYGNYFHGDFLAYMVGTQERFANAFGWVLPATEIARLEGYDAMRTGAGPYRVAFAPFVLASNGVWLAELGLPVLLIARRTRVWGALGGIALMASIQVAALELGFAFLFLNLLFLSLPGDWNRRLLPAFALVFLYALGAAAGWLPGRPERWQLM
ncbi:MAG: hypothetical protein QNK03_19670 [Myxococcota bacterium]|nr:hypothetical protein [Myxococcota bacterium]